MSTTKTVHPEDRPDRASDRNLEDSVEGTFPASDPVSTTASQGARAVPADRIMEAAGKGAGDAPPRDSVTVSRSFVSGEAAKLALETLVREGPVDRSCAEIRAEGGGTVLALKVSPADADRLRGLLAKGAG